MKPRLGKPTREADESLGGKTYPYLGSVGLGRCVYGILQCEEQWDPKASPASLSCFCPEQVPLGRCLE